MAEKRKHTGDCFTDVAELVAQHGIGEVTRQLCRCISSKATELREQGEQLEELAEQLADAGDIGD